MKWCFLGLSSSSAPFLYDLDFLQPSSQVPSRRLFSDRLLPPAGTAAHAHHAPVPLPLNSLAARLSAPMSLRLGCVVPRQGLPSVFLLRGQHLYPWQGTGSQGSWKCWVEGAESGVRVPVAHDDVGVDGP